jgi:tetraacyldisaccharide-1-P 4'-kinase
VAKLRQQRPDDVFALSRTDFGFFPADGSGLEAPPPSKAFAFCGIGLPERFFKDLAVRGVSIVARRAFRDHHPFSEQDLRDLARAADESRGRRGGHHHEGRGPHPDLAEHAASSRHGRPTRH